MSANYSYKPIKRLVRVIQKGGNKIMAIVECTDGSKETIHARRVSGDKYHYDQHIPARDPKEGTIMRGPNDQVIMEPTGRSFVFTV